MQEHRQVLRIGFRPGTSRPGGYAKGILLLAIGIGLCGGTAIAQNSQNKSNVVGATVQNAAINSNPGEAKEILSGEKVFMDARCYVCHGQYGYGGVGPRFREDRFLGVTGYVIGQILVGRSIMPAFADTLNDQQIADVATYIRNSWGNDFGRVNANAVTQTRDELKLKPPQGQPHVPPTSQQPPGVPAPPAVGQPPGTALPPKQL